MVIEVGLCSSCVTVFLHAGFAEKLDLVSENQRMAWVGIDVKDDLISTSLSTRPGCSK